MISVVPSTIVPLILSETAPPTAPKSASIPNAKSLDNVISPRFLDSTALVLKSNIPPVEFATNLVVSNVIPLFSFKEPLFNAVSVTLTLCARVVSSVKVNVELVTPLAVEIVPAVVPLTTSSAPFALFTTEPIKLSNVEVI